MHFRFNNCTLKVQRHTNTFSYFHIFLLNCRKKYQVTKNVNENYKPIDIKEVFSAKSPGLSKIIPGFVYRYIGRLIHIDFINDFLKRNGHLYGTAFVDQVIKEFNVNLYIHGENNIPQKGRYIFASNHPLGGFDGMLLLKIVYERLGALKFLSNDILMNINNLKDMFVPVNKHGSHSRDVARIISETYKSEQQIMIFPAGLASRKIQGEIIDLEWKKHFISKSVKYKRDIVPVFIAGRNSNRFYRMAKIRKFFRIKWNLEMFLLPDETYRHRNADVHIYFGKPISYKFFSKEKTHGEWSKFIKNMVYELPDKI